MKDFTKVIRIGNLNWCKNKSDMWYTITYQDNKLSIVGDVGPCTGQIGDITTLYAQQNEIDYAKGWNANMVFMFTALWNKYNLNDRKAGNEAQEFFVCYVLETNNVDNYDDIVEMLDEAGLEPSGGYEYGTEWLTIPVPEWALEWLYNLPDADKKYIKSS